MYALYKGSDLKRNSFLFLFLLFSAKGGVCQQIPNRRMKLIDALTENRLSKMIWAQQSLQATSMGTAVSSSMYSMCSAVLNWQFTSPLTIVNWTIYYNSAYELRSSMIWLHTMPVTASAMHQNAVIPSEVWCKDNIFSWFIDGGSYNY